ncbi:hypothetical protein JNK13_04370 [bacterium]|nr:hypothetical protein [bacterium]
MAIEQLRELGFSANEIQIYLDLLEVGKATAQNLAKRNKLPRTTAYSVLEGLTKRGVVSTEKKGQSSFFIANAPSSLFAMIEDQEEVFMRKKKAATDLQKTLEPIFKRTILNLPKLRFFEGKANVHAMLYELFPVWQESIMRTDKTWWGFQDHTFVVQYPDWLKYTWDKRKPGEIYRAISNDAAPERELRGKIKERTVKYLQDSPEVFESTIWAIGDYLVLISSRNRPHYALNIKDQALAQGLRQIFKSFWRML